MSIVKNGNCFYYSNNKNSNIELWCDLGDIHRSIREKAEEQINNFINSKKALSIVIQAPYGSGKTTLLKYLLIYSWEIGVPAFLINLSKLVEFIKNYYNKDNRYYIPEDELPKIIAEFYNKIRDDILNAKESISEYTSDIYIQNYSDILKRSDKFIILIDEVEEALEDFKKDIRYETSPFRTIFTKSLDGNSKFYPILAFGPATMAKDVVVGPTQWRPLTIGIPPVSSKTIEDLIEKDMPGIEEKYKKSISNFLWFLTRGRLGWIHKLLMSKLHGELYDILTNNYDYAKAYRFLISNEGIISKYFGSSNKFTKDVEIVDLSSLKKDIENNYPYAYLILNVSPLDSKIIGGSNPSKNIYYSNTLIKNSYLYDEIKNMIENQIKNVKIETDTYNYMFNSIEAFLNAISDKDGYILFKEDFLKDLKQALLAYVQDMLYQDPEAEKLIDNINVDYLFSKLEHRAEVLENKTFVQISPSKMLEYFPLLTTLPLIGYSREHKDNLNESCIMGYNDMLNIDSKGTVKLMTFGSNFIKALEEIWPDKQMTIFPIILSSLKYNSSNKIEKILTNKGFLFTYNIFDSSHKIVFLIINDLSNEDENEKNIIMQNLNKAIEPLKYINKAIEVQIEGRLALFIKGLIVNYMYTQTIANNDKMTVLEKKIFNTFSNELVSLIIEELEASHDKKYEIDFKDLEQITKSSIPYNYSIDACAFLAKYYSSKYLNYIKNIMENILQYHKSSEKSNFSTIYSELLNMHLFSQQHIKTLEGFLSIDKIIKNKSIKGEDIGKFYNYYLINDNFTNEDNQSGNFENKFNIIVGCLNNIFKKINEKNNVIQLIEYIKNIIINNLESHYAIGNIDNLKSYYNEMRDFISNILTQILNVNQPEGRILLEMIFNYSFSKAIEEAINRRVNAYSYLNDFINSYKKLNDKIRDVNTSLDNLSKLYKEICNKNFSIDYVKEFSLQLPDYISMDPYNLLLFTDFLDKVKLIIENNTHDNLINYFYNFNILLNYYKEMLEKVFNIIQELKNYQGFDNLTNELIKIIPNNCEKLYDNIVNPLITNEEIINDYVNTLKENIDKDAEQIMKKFDETLRRMVGDT